MSEEPTSTILHKSSLLQGYKSSICFTIHFKFQSCLTAYHLSRLYLEALLALISFSPRSLLGCLLVTRLNYLYASPCFISFLNLYHVRYSCSILLTTYSQFYACSKAFRNSLSLYRMACTVNLRHSSFVSFSPSSIPEVPSSVRYSEI